MSAAKWIQTFVNSCLRRILLGVWWPETVSDERLWQCACQMPVEQEIRQRRWRWIGHTDREAGGAVIWKQTPKKLETVGDIFGGPECLVESCWWPMPQDRQRRL